MTNIESQRECGKIKQSITLPYNIKLSNYGGRAVSIKEDRKNILRDFNRISTNIEI